MFGLVLVSDGQNEGPLNNGSDIHCSACSPLVWDNLGLFQMYMYSVVELHRTDFIQYLHAAAASSSDRMKKLSICKALVSG